MLLVPHKLLALMTRCLEPLFSLFSVRIVTMKSGGKGPEIPSRPYCAKLFCASETTLASMPMKGGQSWQQAPERQSPAAT